MALAKNYGLVKSLDQLRLLADALMEQGDVIGFDVETGYSGPDRIKGALDMMWSEQFISGFSITNNPSWARYVPVAHDNGPNLPEQEVWEIMKPVLETLPVVAHHLKFEQRNLMTLDWKGRGPSIDISHGRDTMLMAYILSEWRTFGLKDLVFEVFGHTMVKIQDLFEKFTENQEKCLRFNTLDLTSEVVAYGCEDAAWTLALDETLNERAKTERPQMYAIEHGISELMKEVEQHGMAVAWEELESEYSNALPFREHMERAVKTSLSDLALRDVSEINLGSSKQMKELLYRDLGYTTTRLTDSGRKAENDDWEPWKKMSTDAVAMEGLSKDVPAIKKMLEMREVEVALRRFKKWLTENHYGVDNRIHASFKQTRVGTGRFSAADPAVQQLPKKWRFTTHMGANVSNPAEWQELQDSGQHYVDFWTGNFRDYIIAPQGTYFLGYDYSQIELRVLAGVSQEPALLQAFEDGIDVHTLTAARMLGIPIETVTEEQRAVGKTQNFALMYQMGVQSLAERLAIPIQRAQELYDAYFAQFNSVGSWMTRAVEVGRANGFAETPFGRKYTVWELQHPAKSVRAKGDRVLINAPIQGGAADYMKIAMLRAQKALKAKGWWGPGKVMLVHNLHDALLFEVDMSIDPVELRELLQEAVVFPVPGFPKIVADWELGYRHGSCKRWKDEDVELINDRWEIVKAGEKPAQPVLTVVPALPDEDMTPEEFDAAMDAGEPVEVEVAFDRNREDPIEVEILVREMPTPEQVRAFLELIGQHPGENTLVLLTPEGEVRVPVGSRLLPADQGLISMALGGASVRLSRESVDVSALARGIDL